MPDHPSATSVKVSVGAKDPQKPSRKPFTFGLPNGMRLIDIIKCIPASQHTPKSSLLDDANLAFQTQTQNRLRLFCDYSLDRLVLNAI